MARKKLTAAQEKAKRERIANKIEANRRETLDKLIELMENDGLEYVKEWKMSAPGVDLFDPHNPVTGTHYRGANLINLAIHCIIHGVTDNRFTTIAKAQANGWKVREGAPKFMIEKCKKFSYCKKDKDGKPVLDENGNEQWFSYVRPVSYWWVVNYSDLEGAPELPKDERPELPEYDKSTFESVLMDCLKETSRCEIREEVSDEAFYNPTFDYVNVPCREQFTSPQAALRTMLHEMAHSTGHPDALDRNQTGRFGTRDYAFEELVAELSSAFSCSQLGLDVVPEDNDSEGMQERHNNHAAYLAGWLKKFRSDTAYLYRAATLASAATDYIIGRLTATHPEYGRGDDAANEPQAA